MLEFVENKVFAAARPEGQEGGLGREVTLRKVLEASLPHVAESFKTQPPVEAGLRNTLGLSFWYLGEPRIAQEQFEAALAVFRQSIAAPRIPARSRSPTIWPTYTPSWVDSKTRASFVRRSWRCEKPRWVLTISTRSRE